MLLTAGGRASAQRVDANATTQAEDAFGINVSGENLGLYNPSSVRGFSPTAAGNIRLDGLYIDQQGGFTNRLIGGYRILVGPSVLGHPFPAPTGVADYGLRRPGPRDLLSVAAQVNSSGGRQIEFDGQAHDVLPGFGVTGGLGIYHYEFGRGGSNGVVSLAVTGTWRPMAAVELVPFYSRIATRDNRAEPIFLLAGDALPPSSVGRRFLGQRWAGTDETTQTYGLIGKVQLGAWQLRAGGFRSQDSYPIAYTPLLVGVLPTGTADRVMIADRGDFVGATSGEIQLARTFEEGPRKHRVYLAAWGRDQERRYGASDAETLSSGKFDEPAPVAEPAFSFGPQTRDRVRQLTTGIAYEGAWSGVGSLNLGLQKTVYRKSVELPGASLPASKADPWLYNVAGAVNVGRSLTLYAGVSHGLEESDVAPQIAVNRNEAPPAIRTSQVDGGVKWTIAPHVTLVADVFSIRKPYYGLDAADVFRNLGGVRHRGAELSLSGSPLKGLSVVAGAVLLDAVVSGEQVDAGIVGRRPVGYAPSTIIASVDYRLPGFKALSFDADVERDGRSVVTLDDRLVLPSQAIFDIGVRYRFTLAHKPAIFRLQANNLTDSASWVVAGSAALQPRTPRQVVARLTIDA